MPAAKTRLLIGLGLAVMGCLVIVALLMRPVAPPSDESTYDQKVRYAFLTVCRDMTMMLYPELASDQVTSACLKENAAMYADHAEDMAYCYETVTSDDLMEWGNCMTEHNMDFAGYYVDFERGVYP